MFVSVNGAISVIALVFAPGGKIDSSFSISDMYCESSRQLIDIERLSHGVHTVARVYPSFSSVWISIAGIDCIGMSNNDAEADSGMGSSAECLEEGVRTCATQLLRSTRSMVWRCDSVNCRSTK